MAVERTCTANGLGVRVDVTNGEYLRYEVRFRGARPLFEVADRNGRVILDKSMGPRAGPFVSEWPRPGESVDIGRHLHEFGALFLTAVEYRFKVSHHRASGATIRVVKNCKYASETASDKAFDRVRPITV